MKRVGGLWEELTSFANLLAAAEQAAAGKRRRADVTRFLLRLEWEILELQRELISGEYRPGPYRSFRIHDPKPRLISAAAFRDRVVHHALTQVIEPVFEPRFSAHSYACRTGFGTHAALAAARTAAARFPHVLKCDVRKYFPAADHQILMCQLARAIKCLPPLALAETIIAGSNEQDPAHFYFPGDDLFTPFERRKGLPLGNQTSQFFANVYLNPVDQLVERQLQPGAYMRYCDDLLLFDHSKPLLRDCLDAIREQMWELRLELHPGKSRIHRVEDDVTFLGWRIFADRTRLVRANVTLFRRRIRAFRREYAAGRMEWSNVRQRVRSWLAHAEHGDTWKLRNSILEQTPFARPCDPGRKACGQVPRGLVEQR